MTALTDTWTLAVRMLKHNVRSPDTIMTVLATPLMLLFAFVFVLGGAMDTGSVPYVNFVAPVVLLMCIISGVSYTAFRVNRDVTGGMFTRLRAMPVARPALVGGHILASVIVNAVSVAVIFAVDLLIGYRPAADAGGWAISVTVLLACLVVFSVMGVAFGLIAKTDEGSGMFSYAALGLLFVSSGFAPTSSMPGPVAAFADHQPMTVIIDTIRGAQLGLAGQGSTWAAFAWLAAMFAGFTGLAVWGNSRASRRLGSS
jgi:ABC-2 type transport system permease protein